MNLSRRNLTETKLEILILEYLNNKPFFEELVKDTEELRFPHSSGYDVIMSGKSKSLPLCSKFIVKNWCYRDSSLYMYKNEITEKLFLKMHGNIMRNRENITNSEYIWY